jgi:single-strand DNA-binding protein
MSGINKVILVGHLGKDPELRLLEGDVPVTSFPLATTEFITKNGVKEEHTEWHNIVLWRGLAEAAAKILRKGKLIYLEGKCRTRSFEDKSGIRRYTTEIVADSFTILGRSSDFDEESLSAKNGAGANNKRERIKPYNTNL